jgi:hypothetical protein
MYTGFGQSDISMTDLENLPNASRVTLKQEIETIPGMVFNAAGQLVISPTPGASTATDWLNTNAKTIAIVAGVGIGVLLLMKVAR